MRRRVPASAMHERPLRRPVATIALLVAMAALVTLAVAGPLAAKPGAKVKTRGFTCVATVASVDVDGRTITAKLIKSNRAMKASIGSVIDFEVLASAKIIKTGPTRIALADVVAGDRVLIRGRISATGAFKAVLVIDRGTRPVSPVTP